MSRQEYIEYVMGKTFKKCEIIRAPHKGKFNLQSDLLFWDPGNFYKKKPTCPNHEDVILINKKKLTESTLTDEDQTKKDIGLWCDGFSNGSFTPRTCYGFSRNILIIGRIYFCHKCKNEKINKGNVLSTHDKVRDQFEAPKKIIYFHQMCMTSELYFFIVNCAAKGLHFTKIIELMQDTKLSTIIEMLEANNDTKTSFIDKLKSKEFRILSRYTVRTVLTHFFKGMKNKFSEEILSIPR